MTQLFELDAMTYISTAGGVGAVGGLVMLGKHAVFVGSGPK